MSTETDKHFALSLMKISFLFLFRFYKTGKEEKINSVEVIKKKTLPINVFYYILSMCDSASDELRSSRDCDLRLWRRI